MVDLFLICLAGFAAGALNAVAGGGTFLTFPTLMALGVPPISANASATLAVLPGYLSSAWGFRHDIRMQGSLSLLAVLGIATICGLAGAGLLIVTPDQAFSGLVPWLLLGSTLLFALGPRLTRAMTERGIPAPGVGLSALGVAAVSLYGGYFNGGLGIMLLALFSLLGFSDLHAMNGLKNLLSALLSIVSALAFVFAGLIAWDLTLPMALSAMVGGYVGARLSRRITNTALLRTGVVAVGAALTVTFFVR